MAPVPVALGGAGGGGGNRQMAVTVYWGLGSAIASKWVTILELECAGEQAAWPARNCS